MKLLHTGGAPAARRRSRAGAPCALACDFACLRRERPGRHTDARAPGDDRAFAVLAGSGITNTGATHDRWRRRLVADRDGDRIRRLPRRQLRRPHRGEPHRSESQRRDDTGREVRSHHRVQQRRRADSDHVPTELAGQTLVGRRLQLRLGHLRDDRNARARRREQRRRRLHLPDRQHADHRRRPATSA